MRSLIGERGLLSRIRYSLFLNLVNLVSLFLFEDICLPLSENFKLAMKYISFCM